MILTSLPKIDPSKSELRQCVRNLLNDLATNQETIDSIIEYFLENGYPSKDPKKSQIWNRSDWIRQAGKIKGVKPQYIMSVQRVDTLIEAILVSYSALEELDVYGIKSGMTSDTFLEALSSLVEERAINAKYSGVMDKVSLRFEDTANMWFTWNENDYESPPELAKFKEDKIKLLSILGLGINLKAIDEDYICICLKMVEEPSFVPHRAGWGDATLYSYWRPISDENIRYGYTYPINLPVTHNQPEAIAENHYFHLDILTNHSFILGS